MKLCRNFIPALVLFVGVTNVFAEDWPQFLGPTRDGVSVQKDILRTWPEEGPEVLWTVPVGIGFGGAVVQDGKVYFLDRDDEVGDNLRCLELATGKELWSFAYDAPGEVMFPGSRGTPTVEDNRIYTCGPYGQLHCIDANTQKPLWSKNVWKDFGGEEIPRWAITQNPLIYGDLLILASQAPEAGVVAYDKMTGDIKWKTPSLGHVGYVSPVIVKVSGQDHVVMITAASGRRGETPTGGKVIGLDPTSGDNLWEYTNWQCVIPVPNVVDAGEGRMLISGAYNAGSAMIKVDKNADGGYEVTELYKTDEFGTHTLPPVLYDGHFYGHYSTNDKREGLVCMNLDGEIKWKTKRSPLFDKGSMILADGLLLSTDGGTKLYLIEPDPSAFKPIATAELLVVKEGKGDAISRRFAKQNWAPMALADGKLLIRDQNQLKCVKVTR